MDNADFIHLHCKLHINTKKRNTRDFYFSDIPLYIIIIGFSQVIFFGGKTDHWAGNKPALPAFIADSQPNNRNAFILSTHLTEEPDFFFYQTNSQEICNRIPILFSKTQVVSFYYSKH